MKATMTRGKQAVSFGVVSLLVVALMGAAGVGRKPDPAQVIPLNQIASQFREAVADVIRTSTLHRRGAVDTFPANPRVYLSLLNDPVLTLALWKDLGESPARLQQIGPDRYTGSDGTGASATWQYVLRSPNLHVMLCDLDYVSPRGAAKLNGRLVLIVRTAFFRQADGELWIKHDIDVYVKVDSRGWKALAVSLRPVVESILEDQVTEAGLFVSLMCRLVETYPDWALSVARQAQIAADARKAFADLVTQTRRPGAFTGRPVVADSSPTQAKATRRR